MSSNPSDQELYTPEIQNATSLPQARQRSKEFRVAVIPGDGIGREVAPAAVTVLRTVGRHFDIQFDFQTYDWGAEYYLQHGRMMPADALDVLRSADAILLGAVGHPEVPDHVTLNGLLLEIRRGFDQYVNLRPAVLYSGVESPLRRARHGEIDLVIVRENTEGEYAQVGGFVHEPTPAELAIQAAVFTRYGIERVMRFSFELALERNGKRRLTSITKSNAQGYGMVLWDRIFNEIKALYPQIETESILVDAAAMKLIQRPESFDVIVASNLFGDILSDVAAAVTGSIGLAPSGNIDPLRRFPSMFEPVHGSAPDIAGRGIANPLAAIMAAAMMLRHLEKREGAEAIEKAVEQLLGEQRVRTPDLGGNSSMNAIVDEVVQILNRKNISSSV